LDIPTTTSGNYWISEGKEEFINDTGKHYNLDPTG
jgi:hypothetical protein